MRKFSTPLRGKIAAFLLAAGILCAAHPALSVEVSLVGLAEKTAILVIDGARPRMLRVGQEGPGGVRLIAVGDEHAVIEIDGERIEMRLGDQPYAPPVKADRATLTLVSDGRGHFITTGTINGASVRLVVDTGASLISMGPKDARRAGVDYLAGEKGYANTANGVATVYRVLLNKVQVGDIILYGIEGIVHESLDMPLVLLGMSFLGRLDMRREGDLLTLTKRF